METKPPPKRPAELSEMSIDPFFKRSPRIEPKPPASTLALVRLSRRADSSCHINLLSMGGGAGYKAWRLDMLQKLKRGSELHDRS